MSLVSDGLIKRSTLSSPPQRHEMLIFWRHLSEAGLIKGTYGSNESNPIQQTGANRGTATVTTTNAELFLPKTPLGGHWVAETSWGSGMVALRDPEGNIILGQNYFTPNRVATIQANAGFINLSYGLTSIITYAIDAKIDDGMPNTGAARSNQDWWAPAASALSGYCIFGGDDQFSASAEYNRDAAMGTNNGFGMKLCIFLLF